MNVNLVFHSDMHCHNLSMLHNSIRCPPVVNIIIISNVIAINIFVLNNINVITWQKHCFALKAMITEMVGYGIFYRKFTGFFLKSHKFPRNFLQHDHIR